ncbi:ECF-type sigma factor [Urbifossiella limnaea]|uniref:ECF sigma factor n=1 Tax=Urbifossiella limnaea TaxID=2528023 RepID=A0A517XPG9_9BACT|nr:ECF-type sigma factor [Urbifossiella limnaea]QDU19398.1 ECF sigma factor [Urbifossiella limnaea]
MSAVTRLLDAAAGGDPAAAADLLPLVYDELRRLAAARLAHESPGQTLQATALVHEAYLRLVGAADPGWTGRGHFFAAAAEAMRRILVDAARAKRAAKRGGACVRVTLADAAVAAELPPDDLLDLDAALDALAAEDAEKAALVRLRFFAGLPEAEAAACLGLSRATASRHWAYARAWLHDRLGANP